MKGETAYLTVFCTVDKKAVARKLARLLLSKKLAACVNIVPGLESFYWWQGKIARSGEFLLIIKTSRKKYAALEKCVRENHPYQTAEIIALPIVKGSPAYLRWLEQSLK